jgi:hypothetical protein
MIILLPVQRAAWFFLAVGAEASNRVAAQWFVAGLKRPPVFV